MITCKKCKGRMTPYGYSQTFQTKGNNRKVFICRTCKRKIQMRDGIITEIIEDKKE